MAKQKIIIANWKMELGIAESTELAKQYKKEITNPAQSGQSKEVVACPSEIVLKEVGEILKDTSIQLGAQDVFWEEDGAYTGEVSVETLEEVGCKYVIIGHSERRKNLLVNYHMIHKQIEAVLDNNKIIPIICVGESLSDREANKHDEIVTDQLQQALNKVHLLPEQKLIIAYEPIWAIGTGKVIKPADAENMHEIIKAILVDLFGIDVVKKQIRVIYGGSVKSNNVADFSKLDNIDGFLVGGASLDAGEFKKIVEQI